MSVAAAAHHSSSAEAPSAHAAGSSGVSPFGLVTLTAFLAWFGGTGYLLTRYSGIWVGFGLMVSVISGLVGVSIQIISVFFRTAFSTFSGDLGST